MTWKRIAKRLYGKILGCSAFKTYVDWDLSIARSSDEPCHVVESLAAVYMKTGYGNRRTMKYMLRGFWQEDAEGRDTEESAYEDLVFMLVGGTFLDGNGVPLPRIEYCGKSELVLRATALGLM